MESCESKAGSEPLRALISGSSSGIGLAVARLLLGHHAELELVGLSRTPGPLAQASEPGSERFEHWATDLADPGQTAARARRYRQHKGRLDLLVLAAGSGGFAPLGSWDPDEIDRLVRLNLTAPMVLVNGLLQALKASPDPLAVFVGSTSARERAPLGAVYGATKAGLAQFAEYLFSEARRSGIRTMLLSPGMTDTPFYGLERFAPKKGTEFGLEPEALAELVHFFFRGPGRRMNPTQLVVEPPRVGVEKRPRP